MEAAWVEACNALTPAALDAAFKAGGDASPLTAPATTALAALADFGNGVPSLFRDWTEAEVNKYVQDAVVPAFWSRFAEFEAVHARGPPAAVATWTHAAVCGAAGDAQVATGWCARLLDAVCKQLRLPAATAATARVRHHFKVALQSVAPAAFQDLMAVFYHSGFQCFHRLSVSSGSDSEGDDSDDDSGDDSGGEGVLAGPALQARLAEFGDGCNVLRDLGLLEATELPFSTVLFKVIDKHLRRICDDEFSSGNLDKATAWLQQAVVPWIRVVLRDPLTGALAGVPSGALPSQMPPSLPTPGHRFSPGTNFMGWQEFDDGSGGESKCVDAVNSLAPETRPDVCALWERRVEFHLYESVCRLRVAQLFDIIREYPEANPVLLDLRTCLRRTQLHKNLVESLAGHLKARLLHPGANTSQILDMFISMLRSLRILDPTGVLFESVSLPVKEYLRSRKDTIRCIITSLTEDTQSELFEELAKRGGAVVGNMASDTEDEAEEGDTVAGRVPGLWYPDPVDADPTKTSQSRRTDLISTLINIYGSKELFVNEYRLLLADRLLSKTSFDTEQEVRTLELLKLRFGEESLTSCEIMIKDLAESKRANNGVRGHEGDAPPAPDAPQAFQAMILSGQFWPPLAGEALAVHPRLQDRLDSFGESFGVLKAPRKLEWAPHLGSVEVDIELGSETRTYTVPPLQASLILHFHDQEVWDLNDLAKVVKVPAATLRRKMMLWVVHGVVAEAVDGATVTYTANTDFGGQAAAGAGAAAGLEDDGDGMASADLAAAAEMKVYESYILGMLSNRGSMGLDSIHNMLKIVMDSSFDKTSVELGRFLSSLVQQEKLTSSGNMYSLRK